MAKRKIVWSGLAKSSLKEVIKYYSDAGYSAYAFNLKTRIKEIVLCIPQNIHLGRETNKNSTRVIIYKPYRIYYTINETQIRIDLVWDSRRNPADLEKLL